MQARQESLIRCAVVDDQSLCRDGLANLLSQFGDLSLVAEARTGAEGIAVVQRHAPDVVLMDLQLPDMSGTDATQAILDALPRTAVCMLTVSAEEDDLFGAIRAGRAAAC